MDKKIKRKGKRKVEVILKATIKESKDYYELILPEISSSMKSIKLRIID